MFSKFSTVCLRLANRAPRNQIRAFSNPSHFSLNDKPKITPQQNLPVISPPPPPPPQQSWIQTQLPSSNEPSLKDYIQGTYACVGVGSAVTLGIMQMAHTIPLITEHPIECMVGGLVISFAGISGLSAVKGQLIRNKEGQVVDMEHPPLRQLSFWTIVGGMGLSAAPMASMIYEISPSILPAATVMSLAVMGGASAYAYTTTKPIETWGPALYGGLVGLIGVGALGMLDGIVFGPQSLMYQMLFDINTYGGIVLFTGLTAYDTRVLLDNYKNGNPDHLGSAIKIYLDFMNMLVRFMEILAKLKKD